MPSRLSLGREGVDGEAGAGERVGSGAGPSTGRPSPAPSRTRMTAGGLQQIHRPNLPVQCPHDLYGERLREAWRPEERRAACLLSPLIKKDKTQKSYKSITPGN